MGDSIRVVCRFRPQNKREVAEGGVPVVSFDDEMTNVKFESKEYPGTFAFDRIFDWQTTQQQVFDYAAGAVIEDVMRGYNGTIFAYGQTGSGKTHTMMGDMESDEWKGLTPRLVETIFSTIFNAPSNLEFTVKVSYMEVYMEKIRDLLNPVNDNLPIHEDKKKGVYVKGLLEVFVGSVEEVYDVMRRGQGARIVASTNMNAESSRSHSIFMMQISLKNLVDGSSRTGKLYLVDLAGSEKVGKTGAAGQTLEEAKMINRSLSALGMVINALTDGKSSHVPYRDSKLTRILQESLGGNSRTTLIINCSPSSFNETETISTLRFGMRAKTIKNKAKINAELSPGELKNLLKKAKHDISQLQVYISSLENEAKIWRAGSSVPKSDWVPALNVSGLIGESATASPSASNGNLPAAASASALPPHIKELIDGGRSSTPQPPISQDERDAFLQRENELGDQLAEAQAALRSVQAKVDVLTEELNFLKGRGGEDGEENKTLQGTLAELRVELEKVAFENKESTITIESLKDANGELLKEVETLKKQVVDAQASAQAATPVEDTAASKTSAEEKEWRKREKMEQMMAEFDPSGFMTDKEKQIRETMIKLAHMKENLQPPSTPEEIASQHVALIEAKTQLAQQDQTIDELGHKINSIQDEATTFKKKKEEQEKKIAALEAEYQELLDKTIRDEEVQGGPQLSKTIQDIKSRLEAQFNSKRETQLKEILELKEILAKRENELGLLQVNFSAAQKSNEELKSSLSAIKDSANPTNEVSQKDEELEKMRKTMAQQLGEFDAMKKKLMRDLQNRCEKVVELEISLDETRDQYNNILRNSNSRAQQQKMAFLERNLEQLTNVQKQLVEQNSTLKKEFSVAERKMAARNERIQNLESLLHDTQTKLELQNQKFEAQLASMREKLQEARSGNPQASSWLYSSRIAKPLRGGGANPTAGEDEDVASEDNDAFNKRQSWYVSLLKK
ncbi:P-loop containing nucleoside triphosphate hydrolase protein [Chytriomyces cf. hyalinus JEL632]|nr:P-loop containing nucleoside triphosphate hydrolase protein [Chytriomyces cf. hyalinus JEL632]